MDLKSKAEALLENVRECRVPGDCPKCVAIILAALEDARREALEEAANAATCQLGTPAAILALKGALAGASAGVINQCDGCRAGLPLRDGTHEDAGRGVMLCEREKYEPSPSPPSARETHARLGFKTMRGDFVPDNAPATPSSEGVRMRWEGGNPVGRIVDPSEPCSACGRAPATPSSTGEDAEIRKKHGLVYHHRSRDEAGGVGP